MVLLSLRHTPPPSYRGGAGSKGTCRGAGLGLTKVDSVCILHVHLQYKALSLVRGHLPLDGPLELLPRFLDGLRRLRQAVNVALEPVEVVVREHQGNTGSSRSGVVDLLNFGASLAEHGRAVAGEEGGGEGEAGWEAAPGAGTAPLGVSRGMLDGHALRGRDSARAAS